MYFLADVYNYVWIAFYSGTIFVIFFLLGGAIRCKTASSSGYILTVILAFANAIWGVALISLPSALAGFLTGRIARISTRIFQLLTWIGVASVLCEALWPSRFVIFSPLTINRPTLAKLGIGILTGAEYQRGGTLMFMGEAKAEQEVTLFGKYPILCGYPAEIHMMRVEMQILISAVLLLCLLLTSFYLFRRVGQRSRNIGLIASLSVYAVLLLPIHGFILVPMILALLAGRYAAQAELVPYFLRPSTTVGIVALTVCCIAVYHLNYAQSLMDGFGWLSISWESMYSVGCFCSVILGAATVPSLNASSICS
jgi:hypothetical protein